MTPFRLTRQTRRTEAEATALFLENEGLAVWFANKYTALAGAWSFDFDDLKQEASIGLWYACLTFDPSKGVKLSVHATQEMRAQVQEFFRRNGIVKGAAGGKIQPPPLPFHDLVEGAERQGHRNNQRYHHRLVSGDSGNPLVAERG